MEHFKFENSVGPGWQRIVAPIIAYCQARNYTILQIKEKFGGLRFYYQVTKDRFGGDEDLDRLIDAAERQSFLVCEWCGNKGERMKQKPEEKIYWIKTLCPEHTQIYKEGKRWWLNEDGTYA